MSPKATPRTHASKTELLRVRNIRSQRHIVPVPPQNEGARTRSSDEPSSNVSAYMSMYVHAQASATSLHRTLNLSANKYYYYYGPPQSLEVFPRGKALKGHNGCRKERRDWGATVTRGRSRGDPRRSPRGNWGLQRPVPGGAWRLS